MAEKQFNMTRIVIRKRNRCDKFPQIDERNFSGRSRFFVSRVWWLCSRKFALKEYNNIFGNIFNI